MISYYKKVKLILGPSLWLIISIRCLRVPNQLHCRPGIRPNIVFQHLCHCPYNAVVTGHFNFIKGFGACDLEPEEKKKIVWINQVRDPVEQFISNFYFLRSTPQNGTFLPNKVTNAYNFKNKECIIYFIVYYHCMLLPKGHNQ